MRSDTFFSAAIRWMSRKALSWMASRRRLISSSPQKKLEKSCTHSKYETITPPELAITSGTRVMPRSANTLSPALVTGPLAPSTTSLALTRSARFSST